MIRTKLAAFAAVTVIFVSTLAPASATTNIATLGVTATVTNNCNVQTQPAALTMSYNELDNVGTLGLSSFTWACTNGAAASVTPTSTNNGGGSNWKAVNGGANLLYLRAPRGRSSDELLGLDCATAGLRIRLALGVGHLQHGDRHAVV
ncbi:MAG TPA: spore coat protein U domain-containing protein [Candidatus Cybelea sp.]|jgi:spore coat protein U-like protein|nr:spore coat protein U domain-containing protein [Candidatus Cybelea sp.]